MGVGLLPYRKDVFLACKTKFRDLRKSQSDLENSLKLLKTNYFDLYQLHGMKTLDDFEKVTSKNGALKTLIEAKEKGLTRKRLSLFVNYKKVLDEFIEKLKPLGSLD